MIVSNKFMVATLAATLLMVSAKETRALTFGFQNTCHEGRIGDRPFVPILEKPRTLFSFNIDVCETENFIDMVIHGSNKIDSGRSINFDWETEFWEGSLALAVESDLSSEPKTGRFTAEGVIKHSVAPPAEEFTWAVVQEGLKHSTQPRANEPAPVLGSGTVDHDPPENDSYTVKFRVDPEVTFFTGRFAGPPINPNDKGWLIEITGRHGAGLPGGFPPPDLKGGDIEFFDVGNAFVEDFGPPPPVPLPATAWMLLTALAGFFSLRRWRPFRSTATPE